MENRRDRFRISKYTIIYTPGNTLAPSLALTEGDQTDSDGDGILDTDDNCPSVPNQDQQDSNDNNVGDVCDENVVLPEGNLAVDEGVEEAQDQDQQDDAEANGETDGDEDTTNL